MNGTRDGDLAGVPVRHERIRGAGIGLHAAVAGDGPPVILLHGFPETWWSWRHQIPALARAGFSAWALDLRGYGRSDAPPDRDAYILRHLAADVAEAVTATGHPRAHIAGHDWGGIVAWAVASWYPKLVGRLVILNAPHPAIYLEKVRRPEQMLRSWYAGFFQLPRLPERALAARDFAVVRNVFRRQPARAGAFTEDDIDEYVRALARPGRLTAALNYYRANFRMRRDTALFRAPVEAETLVIWGERDPALGVALLDGLERVAPRVRIARLPHASHWVQNDAPDEVNAMLVGFLSERASAPPGNSVPREID